MVNKGSGLVSFHVSIPSIFHRKNVPYVQLQAAILINNPARQVTQPECLTKSAHYAAKKFSSHLMTLKQMTDELLSFFSQFSYSGALKFGKH